MNRVVLIFALTLPLFCACSTGKHRVAHAPQYAGVTRKAEDITKTISLIQSDSKEVKRLQSESMSLLDRLDYKTTILLK